MSHVLEFLERMGSDAELQSLPDAELNEALRKAGLAVAERRAILARNEDALESLLSAVPNVCCLVNAPQKKEEEEEEQEEQEEENDEEDEEALLSGHVVARVA